MQVLYLQWEYKEGYSYLREDEGCLNTSSFLKG